MENPVALGLNRGEFFFAHFLHPVFTVFERFFSPAPLYLFPVFFNLFVTETLIIFFNLH
jgi:hypothetical protein